MNIVSGFITGINERSDRDLEKYIEFGKQLMSVEIPMTIFTEKQIFDTHLRPSITEPIGEIQRGTHIYKGGVMDGIRLYLEYCCVGHIQFVFFEKTDLFLWPFRSLAHRFYVNTNNPKKDTLEYMMVQCQKLEWVNIAISLRPSITTEYVWIDFGAFHMFDGKIDVFQLELYKMRSRIMASSSADNRVKFAHCWSPERPFPLHLIYTDINWTFAGSVFGGKRNSILKLATIMREKCFQILREKNSIMWEINVWVLIYQEHRELFTLYPSDHTEIIFQGYSAEHQT